MSAEHDVAVSFRYDLVRAIREALGLPENVAVPMADHIARGLTRRMGGLYIPSRDIRRDRDSAILSDFNGRNHAEVMRTHGISKRTLYRVISQKRNCAKT